MDIVTRAYNQLPQPARSEVDEIMQAVGFSMADITLSFLTIQVNYVKSQHERKMKKATGRGSVLMETKGAAECREWLDLFGEGGAGHD